MISEIERGMVGARNEMVATVWLMGRGYQVFRNVSPHGPIDLIGMKDGKFEYFDVKMSYIRPGGGAVKIKVNSVQAALGVKILHVMRDGSCEVDEAPSM